MKILMTLVCAISIAFSSLPENTINVKSEAEQKFKPNLANFSFTLEQTSLNADSTVILIKPKIDAVEKIFKEYKLDSKSVVIKGMNISINYEKNKDRERVKNGYIAIRRYQVHMNDLDKLSDFIVDLKLSGISQIGTIEFTHTSIDSLEQIVLVNAIKKAKRIGLSIANESGVKLGIAQMISNEQPHKFTYENRVNVDFEFGKNSQYDEMIEGLMANEPPTQTAREKYDNMLALKKFFKIEVQEIVVKNEVWISFPIEK